MKTCRIQLFSTLAAVAAAFPACGLTIIPTWDSSITTNPNAAAITNGILFAIQTEESNLNDDLTVQIKFVDDPDVDLGENTTWYVSVPYSGYLASLAASATSVNDRNALTQLPNSPNDPVISGTQIDLQLPLARLFGFVSGYGPDGFDSTIDLNIPIMNLSRPPANPDDYDLVSVTEHEMDEALGFVSSLAENYPTGPIATMDLFRYTTNLVRTWTTNGDNAYFSVDGTNLLARFNQHAGGDYHDWWSYTALWAPPGTTPYPQVQDAYALPGTSPDLGSNELTGLDVIGYTLASATPALHIVASGNNHFTLSWFATSSGYVLQQTTNLLSNAWVDSPSGSTNFVTIASANTEEFFRLARVFPPALVTRQAKLSIPAMHQVTHVYHRAPP